MQDENHSNETNGAEKLAIGINRRKLMVGAAWAAPTVAVALAAPLAAASTVTSIAFTAATYSANACGTFSVTIQALNGTAPSANSPVTVTLPDGIMWADGSTAPRTLTTNASGQVTFSLKAPANNGTYTIEAASGTAAVTAKVAVANSTSGLYVWQNFNKTASDYSTTYGNVPAGATPLGNNFFLSNGNLWWGNKNNTGGKIIASGVTQAVGFHSTSNSQDADWATMLVGGTWKSFYGNTSGSGFFATYPNVPSSAKALQNFYFLAGTDLYYGNTKVLTNVSDAFGYFGGDADYVDVLIGGVWYTYNNQNGFGVPLYTSSSVPAGAVPVGNQYYLVNGSLYWRTNSSPVATGVAQAVGFRSANLNYADVLVNGVWKSYSEGSLSETYATPAGAAPLRNHYFLYNGSLYYKGTVIATGVLAAQGYLGGKNTLTDFVNFHQAGVCS